mgnify:CR=1 FL=1
MVATIRSQLGPGVSFLLNIISIMGSIMIFKYIEKLNMVDECKNISPKHLDFIEKYTYFILFSSIARVVFSYFKIF